MNNTWCKHLDVQQSQFLMCEEWVKKVQSESLDTQKVISGHLIFCINIQ